jgi:hypothetical protein
MMSNVHVDTINVAATILSLKLNKDFSVSYDIVAGETFSPSFSVDIPKNFLKGNYKIQARVKSKGSVLSCDQITVPIA